MKPQTSTTNRRDAALGILALALSSCSGGGDSSFGNILDEAIGEVVVEDPVICTIDSSLPASTTVKVVSTAGTNTSFGVSPNSTDECAITWTLNGATMSGATAFKSINSALFNAGSNTLVATVANAGSTASRTWTVTKNIPPTCGSQTPAAGGNTIDHTATLAFSGTATNTDTDTLSFAWQLGGAAQPLLFTSISSVGNTSSTVFDPAFANVGANQTVALVIDDGYETGSCTWTVTVSDPNTLAINACLPDEDSGTVGNQVVLASAGGSSAKTLIASNSGGANFVWKLDGSTVGGATTDSLNLTAGGVSVGNHTVVAEVRDANNLPAGGLTCTWALKRNSPPVLSGQSPTAPTTPVVQKYRVSYISTQLFSANVADANGDAVTYTWKMDGVTLATGSQAPGALTYNLNPAGNVSLLGAHTITLEANDGSESATTLTWEIEINAFSTACNTVLNTPVSVGTLTNAPICTLVGSPAIGDGLNPTTNQEKIRIIPAFMVEDGSGNLFISDHLNQSVWLYTQSGSSASYFGNTYAANQMHLIIGNGSNGVTVNNIAAKYATKLNFSLAVNGVNNMRRGGGIAFDSAAGVLYVADWGNNRVVRVEPAGTPNVFGTTPGNAVTVIGATPGGTTPTNITAGNTDGNAGTTHFCANPAGLTLTSVGAERWLYVTCYTSNTIKRMNVNPSDSTADANGVYGSTFTVVGRMSGGVSAAGNFDGTLGPNGESMSNNPYAITSDSNGNIYWTEWARGRVRMATMDGLPMTIFSGPSTSVAQNIDNGAGISLWHSTLGNNVARDPLAGSSKALRGDATDPALPAACTGAACYAGVTAAAAGIAIAGPNRLVTNECTPHSVNIREGAFGAHAGSAFTVNLTNPTGAGTFYNNPTCTGGGIITSVTVPMNSGTANFYFRTTANETKNINAAIVGGTNVNRGYVSAAAAAATRVVVHTPGAFYYDDCVRLVPQLITTGDVGGTLGSTTTLTMATRGTGTFYANSTCTTPSSTATILAGSSTGEIYYSRDSQALGNRSLSFIGRDDGNNFAAAATDTTPDLAEAGTVGFRLPSGIAVKTTAGVPTEIYVSNELHNRITFINASGTSLNRGGQTIEPGDGQACVGNGNTVYNGDNNSGNGVAGGDQTVVYNPSGLLLRNSNADLYFADNNYRLRSLDIGSTQRVTTIVGNGIGRLSFSTDNAVDAPDALMNAPSHIIVNNSTKIAYVADTFNGRIRRVNLVTGRFDTIVGNAYTGTTSGTDAPVENFAAASSKSSGYRAVSLYNTTSPNTNTFMLMTEHNAYAAGITRSSLVRAWNMSGPATTLFGVTIGADKVSTIGGDYSSGSKTWIGAPANNDGGNNTSLTNLLFNPEGIATVGSKFYVSNHSDHTIVEYNPSNNSSKVVIGTGVAGALDGAGTGATIRFPTVITPDTVAGNFFFADNVDQSTSKIRYANFSTSLDVAGITITGGSATVPQVATIVNYAPTGSQGHVWGIAVNSTYICYASGPGGGSYQATSSVSVVPAFDGSVGGHNVTCVTRADGTSVGRVGPSDGGSIPTRAGGPFNASDQEGITAGSARLSSPVGLSFDHEGNLLVVEKGNGLVRLVRRWY